MKASTKEATPSPALAAVHAHQAAIDAARAEVARIDDLITEQTEVLEEAPSPDVAGLERRLQDTLAAFEVDQVTENELREAEAKLEEAKTAVERAAPAMRRARSTLEGLRRLLADAQARVAALEGQMPKLVYAALREEAEAVGADYVNAAELLKQHYLRLRALEQLARNVTNQHRNHFLSNYTAEVAIPAFALSAFDGKVRPAHPGVLFSSSLESYSNIFGLATQAEAERLRSAGVPL